MEPIFVAKNITKSFEYPTHLSILSDISLEAFPRQSIAIVGKSGEGKTTLLHILGTLDEATSGELFIAGKKVVANMRDSCRLHHIGFVFQAFHLLTDATVLDNVLLPLQIARKPIHKNSLDYARATHFLEMVGLQDRLHFRASKLSGGEKQRVAIARAFVNDPDIILADEPTGNLDHGTAQGIQDLLFRAVADEGKALIVVTHNLALAKQTEMCYELEYGALHKIP